MVGPLAGTTGRLVQTAASEGCRSAEMKTTEELRTAGTQQDERGWMSEKYFCSRTGRSVALTSLFINPRLSNQPALVGALLCH